ncbi:hypothetical protein [Xenorhabdus sp. Sc-CR9]|uniref:hypothetical protein n=1 Tax=Xenorhabdus sp. Sc-CR9 TaxID=2584468 RepID=UPI001F19C007|nr:hypothetical protein [Xenorhabdus sp. Sc-CR9]
MTDRSEEKLGRRERKKKMLRDALIKASYELFSIKGFDETRVEDITNNLMFPLELSFVTLLQKKILSLIIKKQNIRILLQHSRVDLQMKQS